MKTILLPFLLGIVSTSALLFLDFRSAIQVYEYRRTMREGNCWEGFADGKTAVGPGPKLLIKAPGFYRVCVP